jgi:hypothetical protein
MYAPDAELALRLRWSLKGHDIASLLIFSALLLILIAPIFAFDILPGEGGAGETALGVLLVGVLIAHVVTKVRDIQRVEDVILSPDGLVQLRPQQRQYFWVDYGPPKFGFMYVRFHPGRCLELQPLSSSTQTKTLRIFDWYDVDLETIQDYICSRPCMRPR